MNLTCAPISRLRQTIKSNFALHFFFHGQDYSKSLVVSFWQLCLLKGYFQFSSFLRPCEAFLDSHCAASSDSLLFRSLLASVFASRNLIQKHCLLLLILLLEALLIFCFVLFESCLFLDGKCTLLVLFALLMQQLIVCWEGCIPPICCLLLLLDSLLHFTQLTKLLDRDLGYLQRELC